MLYWDYYISLEEDLLACRRYVEFHNSNMNAYSIEFVRLLLATCSEIDVLAKVLCRRITPNAKPSDIEDYRDILDAKLFLSKFEVEGVQTQELFRPFEGWANQNSPIWWKAHNDVKHNRASYYKDATLKNCLCSLAGLFVLNLYEYHDVVGKAELSPEPKLFKPRARVVPFVPRIILGYQLPHVDSLGARNEPD